MYLHFSSCLLKKSYIIQKKLYNPKKVNDDEAMEHYAYLRVFVHKNLLQHSSDWLNKQLSPPKLNINPNYKVTFAAMPQCRWFRALPNLRRTHIWEERVKRPDDSGNCLELHCPAWKPLATFLSLYEVLFYSPSRKWGGHFHSRKRAVSKMILLKEIVLPVSAKISLTPSRPMGDDLYWEKSTYIIIMDPYSRELVLMKEDYSLCRFSNNEYCSLLHPHIYLFFNLQNLIYFFSNAMTLQSRYINM